MLFLCLSVSLYFSVVFHLTHLHLPVHVILVHLLYELFTEVERKVGTSNSNCRCTFNQPIKHKCAMCRRRITAANLYLLIYLFIQLLVLWGIATRAGRCLLCHLSSFDLLMPVFHCRQSFPVHRLMSPIRYPFGFPQHLLPFEVLSNIVNASFPALPRAICPLHCCFNNALIDFLSAPNSNTR